MTRLRIRAGRTAVVAAVTAGALLSTGTAFAYWKATGSGSGTAKVGVGQTIRANAVTPATGLLFPSTTPNGSLALTFTTPVNALVTGIAKDPARPVISSVTGCGAFLDMPAVTGLSIAVTAPGPSPVTTLPNRVRLLMDTPANCQGATFTIPVVLTTQETP
ncbi:hypothetical protein GCM10009547_17140 [Sporichthya brevicatena]|uniref:Ribosomally synthesized peptide with SipW-like signal peptide n=1 Tax=Sporichthya brevicatena TaxID=171442 RepID=A0ABP3RWN9_9ACTN